MRRELCHSEKSVPFLPILRPVIPSNAYSCSHFAHSRVVRIRLTALGRTPVHAHKHDGGCDAVTAIVSRRRFEVFTPPTSAPGLGPPRPHLRRDWAHPAHICAGIGLTPPTHCRPGLTPPTSAQLRRDWGSPRPHLCREAMGSPRPHLRRDVTVSRVRVASAIFGAIERRGRDGGLRR